jgi:hypothetical protein
MIYPRLVFETYNYTKRAVPFDLALFAYFDTACLKRSNELLDSYHRYTPGGRARYELLCKIHDAMNAKLQSGGSQASLETTYNGLKSFYMCCDDSNINPSELNVHEALANWANFVQSNSEKISAKYSNTMFKIVTGIIAKALRTPVSVLTRGIRKPKGSKSTRKNLNSSDLNATFAFGQMCYDICQSLEYISIMALPPINISIRNGYTEQRWGLKWTEESIRKVLSLPESEHHRIKPNLINRRAEINLRIQAEASILMAQSGLSPAQMIKLPIAEYTYHVEGDNIVISAFKHRRQGMVSFPIYKEYKRHFIKYLEFRKELDALFESDKLFPQVGIHNEPVDNKYQPKALKDFCKRADVEYRNPLSNKAIRSNWFSRKTGGFDIGAKLNQHTPHTNIANYHRDDENVASLEFQSYWDTERPKWQAIINGSCADKTPISFKHEEASTIVPNCQNPSGCLFCKSFRGQRTLDWVWALLSYREVKKHEAALIRSKINSDAPPPAFKVIQRIGELLSQYKSLGNQEMQWAIEAEQKITDFKIHPSWRYYIQLVDLSNE